MEELKRPHNDSPEYPYWIQREIYRESAARWRMIACCTLGAFGGFAGGIIAAFVSAMI